MLGSASTEETAGPYEITSGNRIPDREANRSRRRRKYYIADWNYNVGRAGARVACGTDWPGHSGSGIRMGTCLAAEIAGNHQ